jgi:hypothetical protein
MRKLITYDLHLDRDYRRLYEALYGIRACWVMFSVWAYDGPESPKEVRDYLSHFIDADDKLLVVEYLGNWASLRVEGSEADCLGPHYPG